LLSDDEIRGLDEKTGYPMYRIYIAYNEGMKEARRMDYDDQLVYAYRILRKYPRILQSVQNVYRYICVDEAQDTSRIQYEIIRMLAGQSGNLFMVGDEDQSIYGFRAAYPEALLDFEKVHAGARVLLMEENFRSDAHIVAAADRYIQNNLRRHEKHMQAFRPARNEIREITLPSRSAQYAYLLNVARNCREETAVLYRDNECALPMIDLLERSGVPYRIRMQDTSFFTHRVVLDLAAIIRFAYDPYDTDAFMQIYYKIHTYLRREQAEMLCAISKSQGISVLDALDVAEDISVSTMRSCREVQTDLWKLRSERADRAIFRIDAMMGYGEFLFRADITRSKIEIMEGIGQNEPSAAHLLKRLESLRELILHPREDRSARFLLSTVHAAKGLEYDTVYLMDVIDRILPETPVFNPLMARAEDVDAYEEDRRLFYVAATRAKNRLIVLTYKDEKSCFCDEFLEKNKPPEKAIRTAKDPGYIAFCEKYGAGARISHKKYGEGTVWAAEEGCLTVRFDDGTMKYFSLPVLYEKSLTE
ncbi:MAG: ATP-dependent helicase, partial [Clostridia bacterium]|nr:ATP-dependent helicase [Clostridia bacterium]